MKKFLSLLFLFIASGAFCAPVRSMVSARDSANAEGESSVWPSAADYIQDGLIAMYDGIENSDFGIHDESSSIWKDLIGDNDAIVSAGGTWLHNALSCNGSACGAVANLFSTSEVGTVECVVSDVPENVDPRGIILGICANSGTENEICPMIGKYYGRYVNAFSPGRSANFNNSFVSSKTTIQMSSLYTGSNSQAYLDTTQVVLDKYGFPGMNTSFGFGGRYYNNAFSFCIACKIHTVRIYSRQLSSEERAFNYRIDKERFGL